MMYKKFFFACIGLLLFLTGCIPSLDQEEEEIIIVEETDDVDEQQFILTPTIDTPENFYRTVLLDGEYQRSPARGVVASAMTNRIDINQFEVGLMEIASAFYEQSEYYFQEGTYLSGDTINSWIRRYNPAESRYARGLNPSLGELEVEENEDGEEIEVGLAEDVDSLSVPELSELMRENPLVLSNVLEHNYVYGSAEEGVNLGGMVIGLSLRAVYYFQLYDDDGKMYQYEQPLELDEVEEKGKEIAQQVVNRIRTHHEDLAEVPITIALFQERPRGSIVPGSFIAMTHVEENETGIQEWEAINEEFYFFPSRAARQAYPNHSNAFEQFKDEMEQFMGRSIGIVGKGRFKNGAIDELTIEFNMQSHGKAEIIALTQFASGRIEEIFNLQVPISVYINSINGPESIVVKYPDHDPFIHVYK
ncbi:MULTISPECIES: CamS family sex pheromone protein [Bacillaceae]|uniref:CamS family sex pheromone protein n=1 Tax=Evansella alkalicola TaxID=745819 RepID=A0ABS6JSP6_9BACI|nr:MULTISPECIES: CamS family sex pheromone protein [Bacillaceae]MBU9721267.1 CamS family sex pheromone protein [Bacillus alkalicola]